MEKVEDADKKAREITKEISFVGREAFLKQLSPKIIRNLARAAKKLAAEADFVAV